MHVGTCKKITLKTKVILITTSFYFPASMFYILSIDAKKKLIHKLLSTHACFGFTNYCGRNKILNYKNKPHAVTS